MAKESKHARTSDLSRGLCDILLACHSQDRTPSRKFSPSYCGVHIKERKAALYWVQHTKGHIWVYLDCDDSPEIRNDIQSLLPIHVLLQARPFPRKGFGIRTPLFFKLQTEEEAQSMGPLLQRLPNYRLNSSRSSRVAQNVYWSPHSEVGAQSTNMEEGARVSILIKRYERSWRNREHCIQVYGALCSVCGFDFSRAYGEMGRGYIHVHHLKSLASLEGKAQKIDPVKDLRPVCPNCHEMLHQSDPPHTIEQLRAIIANAKDGGTTC